MMWMAQTSTKEVSEVVSRVNVLYSIVCVISSLDLSPLIDSSLLDLGNFVYLSTLA